MVKRAATQATSLVDLTTATTGTTPTVSVNGTPISVTYSSTDPLVRADELAAAVNGASLGFTAQSNGSGQVTLTAGSYGSGSFSVTATDLTTPPATTIGHDVVVSVNGTDTTGAGQSVTVAGLGLSVTLTDGDVTALANASAGTVSLSRGLASRLANLGWSASDSVSGSLTTAVNGTQSLITDLNQRIDDWDTRLEGRRAALQKQYADLETALGKLKDQSAWLSSQITALPATTATTDWRPA